jgi:hypothetical protein
MSCHEFHDPIVDWIDSLLSKTPRATSFGMLPVCNIRYQLFIEFLLYLLFSSHTFSSEQQGRSSNLFLERLFCKFIYT